MAGWLGCGCFAGTVAADPSEAGCLLAEDNLRPCTQDGDDAPPPLPKATRPSQAVRARLNPPARPKAGEPINDQALFSYLEREGRRLANEGATLTNWGTLPDREAPPTRLGKRSNRKRNLTDLAAEMEKSVAVIGVLYECDNCTRMHLATATGFLVSSDGAVATCRHVLAASGEKGRGVVVMTRDGAVHAVQGVLGSDTLNDLLVLQIQGRKFPALPLSTEVAVGAPVTVLSHPERHFYVFTAGAIARRSGERRAGGWFERVGITAEFAKGSSGAPVCDESGSVVAMVNSTQSIYYSLEKGEQRDFQMAIRECTPVSALMRVLSKGSP